MDKNARRSGLSLVLMGLIGMAFFWLTDPRLQPQRLTSPVPASLSSAARDAVYADIDMGHVVSMGTVVGVAGCGTVLLLGLWMTTRRSV